MYIGPEGSGKRQEEIIRSFPTAQRITGV